MTSMVPKAKITTTSGFRGAKYDDVTFPGIMTRIPPDRRPYMERKYVDPWNTQFKNIQILYILKRPLEKGGWTALKQRGIEWDESTFLREAFEKLTAWTQNQVERDFLKRRSLLGLEYGLNVIWWVPRHVICASWQESRTWNTHPPTRDQTDQILRHG